MQEEVFIIMGLALAAVTFIALVKAILGYLTSRHKSPASEASSLSHRELEALIEGAVERATASLHERLDRLETRALPPKEEAVRFGEEEPSPVGAERHLA